MYKQAFELCSLLCVACWSCVGMPSFIHSMTQQLTGRLLSGTVIRQAYQILVVEIRTAFMALQRLPVVKSAGGHLLEGFQVVGHDAAQQGAGLQDNGAHPLLFIHATVAVLQKDIAQLVHVGLRQVCVSAELQIMLRPKACREICACSSQKSSNAVKQNSSSGKCISLNRSCCKKHQSSRGEERKVLLCLCRSTCAPHWMYYYAVEQNPLSPFMHTCSMAVECKCCYAPAAPCMPPSVQLRHADGIQWPLSELCSRSVKACMNGASMPRPGGWSLWTLVSHNASTSFQLDHVLQIEPFCRKKWQLQSL